MVPHPAGSPGYAGALPRYTHSPYMPHQPLLEVHSQPAYPAYYLREARYGLPPPMPSPLPVVPPPDQRDLELAYLRAMWQAWTAAPRTLRPPGGRAACTPGRSTRPCCGHGR